MLFVCGGELASVPGVAGGNMKYEDYTFLSIYKNKDQPAADHQCQHVLCYL